MSFNKLLADVKVAGEDFEWYPTDTKMIEVLFTNLSKNASCNNHVSIMDVGAGNGKVLNTLKILSIEHKDFSIEDLYAIEKSKILREAMGKDIFVVGTDFWQQTLIDKKVDIIFSNPPYSMWSNWTEKIIKEANADFLYLIIPERWEKDSRITLAIEQRGATVEIIETFTFENAEDRKARAKVHLLMIQLKNKYNKKIDPFELWFDETYPFEKKEKIEEELSERVSNATGLVSGIGLIERLEKLYLDDMNKLNRDFLSISSIDSNLLEQMGISKADMMHAMKQKIQGLKTLYWTELFGKLSAITSRLTSKSREILLDKLRNNMAVDFTVDNAYSIVIFVIKNANAYYDSQLLSVYNHLLNSENIILYKSNQRTLKDDWRYLRDEMSHYSLDYRIILHSAYGLANYGSKLSHNGATLLSDISTIANNLGFRIESSGANDFWWESQVKNYFYFSTKNSELNIGDKTFLGKIEDKHFVEKDGSSYWQYFIDGSWYHPTLVKTENDVFAEVKAFRNGNLHIKFNKQFMKALNIEAARLNNWIKSPQEAAEEFDIDEEEAIALFGVNYSLMPSELQSLLPR